MSLRLRTTLASMVAVFVAIFVFGAALGGLVRASAPNDQAQRLNDQGASIAGLVTSGLEPDTANISSDFLVLTDTGDVRLASRPFPDVAALHDFATGASNGESDVLIVEGIEYRVASTPWSATPTGKAGLVVTYERTDTVEEQLMGLRAVIWLAAIFATLTAGVVAWFASGRALRPLRAIAEAADEIADTSTDRLPPAARSDEIGSLTSSLNGMLDRLATARSQLSDSIKRQEQFVADASHELRSPMTTIRSNAEFLVSRPDADAGDVVSAAADIVAEAERMSILVDDLLTLAQSDEHEALRMEPVDLTGLVARLALAESTPRRPVSLEVPEQITVSGDHAAIERLIRILIDNARHYGSGTITLGLANAHGGARLTVTDEGPGLHPDHVNKIFDRFFRSNPARSPHGTGLGLAIAKATAEAHGGTIYAENAEPGARIVVTLPNVSPSSHPPPM